MENLILKLDNIPFEDYPKQIELVDKALEFNKSIMHKVINLLDKVDDSLFVAERISNAISNTFNELNLIFDQHTDRSLRFNIALIFLSNGNNSKNAFLLKFVSEAPNASDAVFCLSKLLQYGVDKADLLIKSIIDKIASGYFVLTEQVKIDLLEVLNSLQSTYLK